MAASSSEKKNQFAELFAFVATIDTTPYLCIPEALRFRQVVCGGEESIRKYCKHIAQIGGQRVAEILGTEILQNSTRTLTNCCFVNVRLPLKFASCARDSTPQNDAVVEGFAGLKISQHELDASESKMKKKIFNPEDAPAIVRWIIERTLIDFDIPIMTKFHAGAIWIRLSGQIYIEMQDFERAAEVLKGLCERVITLEVS